MKEFNSPSPQPEDPGRALDPGLEEDPDISVELVDGTFYHASCDDTLVAIIADYPGLLPASRVSKAEALTSEEDSFLIPCLMHKYHIFIETIIGMRRRALISKGHPGQAGSRGRRLGSKHHCRGIVKICCVIIMFEM